jgi:hypothetical protein
MGEGRDGFGFDLTLGDGGEEASECGAEVTGRHVLAGKIAGDLLAHFLASEDLGFPAGMEGAEIMAVAAWNAAAAAIGERERTQGHAVLWADRAHRSLLKERFWIFWGVSRKRGALLYGGKCTRLGVVMSILILECIEWSFESPAAPRARRMPG